MALEKKLADFSNALNRLEESYEALADEIFSDIKAYLPVFSLLYKELAKH